MAILVIAEVPGQTVAQYDAVIQTIQTAGHWPPRGQQVHIAAQRGDGTVVVDVWDSQEALDKFLTVAVSPAEQVGVTLGEVQIYEIHNVVTHEGKSS
jgi:hypothetical protein